MAIEKDTSDERDQNAISKNAELPCNEEKRIHTSLEVGWHCENAVRSLEDRKRGSESGVKDMAHLGCTAWTLSSK